MHEEEIKDRKRSRIAKTLMLEKRSRITEKSTFAERDREETKDYEVMNTDVTVASDRTYRLRTSCHPRSFIIGLFG